MRVLLSDAVFSCGVSRLQANLAGVFRGGQCPWLLWSSVALTIIRHNFLPCLANSIPNQTIPHLQTHSEECMKFMIDLVIRLIYFSRSWTVQN